MPVLRGGALKSGLKGSFFWADRLKVKKQAAKRLKNACFRFITI
jgi:hypothetical protein